MNLQLRVGREVAVDRELMDFRHIQGITQFRPDLPRRMEQADHQLAVRHFVIGMQVVLGRYKNTCRTQVSQRVSKRVLQPRVTCCNRLAFCSRTPPNEPRQTAVRKPEESHLVLANTKQLE